MVQLLNLIVQNLAVPVLHNSGFAVSIDVSNMILQHFFFRNVFSSSSMQ